MIASLIVAGVLLLISAPGIDQLVGRRPGEDSDRLIDLERPFLLAMASVFRCLAVYGISVDLNEVSSNEAARMSFIPVVVVLIYTASVWIRDAHPLTGPVDWEWIARHLPVLVLALIPLLVPIALWSA